MRGEWEWEEEEEEGRGKKREEQGQVGLFPCSLSLPPLSSWPRGELCLGAAAGVSPSPPQASGTLVCIRVWPE